MFIIYSNYRGYNIKNMVLGSFFNCPLINVFNILILLCRYAHMSLTLKFDIYMIRFVVH